MIEATSCTTKFLQDNFPECINRWPLYRSVMYVNPTCVYFTAYVFGPLITRSCDQNFSLCADTMKSTPVKEAAHNHRYLGFILIPTGKWGVCQNFKILEVFVSLYANSFAWFLQGRIGAHFLLLLLVPPSEQKEEMRDIRIQATTLPYQS